MFNFQAFSSKEIDQTEIIKNKVEKLLFITTNNFVKADIYWTGSAIINSHIITNNIVDDNNNILISDEDLEKCLYILELFECLKDCYSKTSGIDDDINEIQNYDKFVTRKFFNNITKINSINISESCQTCSFNVPIILPIKRIENVCSTKLQKRIEEYKRPDNVFSDMDLVIDWLFKNCEHVETFEIGVFAAVTQALYVTEGFDAFTKFVTYAESLDDENRVNLVNKLIAYYNIITKKSETIHKLVGDKVVHTTVLEFIPNIIKSFNLCETIHAYPESMTASIIEANNKNNNLYNSFIDIAKNTPILSLPNLVSNCGIFTPSY